MPLGLFKKVGNYRWTGGLGAELPAGSRGSALVGVQGGEAPLKLELFLNQNCPESHQLKRMVVTHVYNTCTGERKKEEKKKKGKKKKSEGLKKSEKRHPCLLLSVPGYICINPFNLFWQGVEHMLIKLNGP